MSGRRTSVIDTREILHRVQLAESDRAVAGVLPMSRNPSMSATTIRL
jgi:hypothetical protein